MTKGFLAWRAQNDRGDFEFLAGSLVVADSWGTHHYQPDKGQSRTSERQNENDDARRLYSTLPLNIM
jgi:hypothetical protein